MTADPSDVITDTPTALAYEWLYDHQIISLRGMSSSREGVDQILNTFQEIINQWDRNRPLLILLDASHNHAILSPYARQRLQEVLKTNNQLKGRTAIIIKKNVFGQLIRLFVRSNKGQGRERQLFFSEDDALTWLKELL